MSSIDPLTRKDRIELLKFLHERTRNEIDYLRTRQDRVFTWSSGILVALIGVLVVVDPSKNPAWSSQGVWGKIIASITLAVLVSFSVYWQQRNRWFHEKNRQVSTRIETLFHCFDEGYFDPSDQETLFPQRWMQQDEGQLKLKKRILRVNYVSATVLLGILAIMMIWFRG